MSFLDAALALAARGFHVFPLRPNLKLPAIKAFPTEATRDEARIREWWAARPDCNIGISTSRFGDDQALLVVDVDNKGGKGGDETVFALELEGFEFPATFTQHTPTGGRHLVFGCAVAVRQGVDVLGRGIDVRSRGGYIVGAGSVVAAGPYTIVREDVADAPAWLIERCGKVKEKGSEASPAAKRAIHYLVNEAPLAVEDAGGDDAAYRVAAKVKDFGIDEPTCVLLLLNHWNDRCAPPWPLDELQEKVANAYRYGQEPIGSAAPETQFTAIEPEADDADVHPFDKLNRSFAFIINGGGHYVLWTDKKNVDGKLVIEHLPEASFHAKFAAWRMTIGDGKTQQVTKLWMQADKRRAFDGLCFKPGLTVPANYFNLWRGFAVEPLARGEAPTADAQRSLDMFLEHALQNVCNGDADLCRWLIGYFAHLVQRPWQKPLVALVFKGSKGVGKNALVERVGRLLGNHFLLTSSRRYLVGNFNGHLENLLLFTLDEAFWSGDKQAEGTLKDLVTGTHHNIERKGHEPYSVDNCTRVVIIGNEDWLVPASQDERRYAVFDVGDGRKQDKTFFQDMRELMEAGGYRLLLRHLLDFDLSAVDVNDAPKTDALLDQKIQSLEPFYQWWHDCLHEGRLLGCEFLNDWPAQITKDQFRAAFGRYATKERNIKSRIPDSRQIGKMLKSCCPSVDTKQKDREKNNVYRLPVLDDCRAEWGRYIGHVTTWE